MNYDIAVIGAGPGGYTAAIRASQLGKKVVLIEKDEIGGTCLNHGCIPTKTINYSTRLYSKLKKADQFGISAWNISIDLGRIVDRKNRIVSQLRKGLDYLFKENKIDSIRSEAKLNGPHQIIAKDQTIEAPKIILATGSSIPQNPPFPIDEKKVFSSNGILNLRTIPKTLAIIGAGAIGVELASIFNELGSNVTLYEMLPRILPGEDSEISDALSKLFIKRGIEIKTSESLKNPDQYEAVLVCTGRTLNVEGFKEIGIKLENGKVAVNEKMQTNIPSIYAVGDIAGKYMFAHTASREGIVAAENSAGKKAKIDYCAVPRCIYSDPGVASVGLTEEQAKEMFGSIIVGRFPFSASSKSLIEDEREGFIKIITCKAGKVLGLHILGAHATELIGEATLAIQNELKVEDIINTIHAHPTVYESIYEAAENVLKQAISIINKD